MACEELNDVGFVVFRTSQEGKQRRMVKWTRKMVIGLLCRGKTANDLSLARRPTWCQLLSCSIFRQKTVLQCMCLYMFSGCNFRYLDSSMVMWVHALFLPPDTFRYLCAQNGVVRRMLMLPNEVTEVTPGKCKKLCYCSNGPSWPALTSVRKRIGNTFVYEVTYSYRMSLSTNYFYDGISYKSHAKPDLSLMLCRLQRHALEDFHVGRSR